MTWWLWRPCPTSIWAATPLACSAETQTKIDQLVVDLVKRQHQKATKILLDNREKLDQLADYLYTRETITGEEFMKILNQ